MSGEAAKQHRTPENLQACADRTLKTSYISEITSFVSADFRAMKADGTILKDEPDSPGFADPQSSSFMREKVRDNYSEQVRPLQRSSGALRTEEQRFYQPLSSRGKHFFLTTKAMNDEEVGLHSFHFTKGLNH